MDLAVDGARAVDPARVLAGMVRVGGSGVVTVAGAGVMAAAVGIGRKDPWVLASASSPS